MLGPSLFANFRYGITQMNFEDRRTSQGFDLSTLGFSKQLLDLIVNKDVAPFPYLSVAIFTPNAFSMGSAMSRDRSALPLSRLDSMGLGAWRAYLTFVLLRSTKAVIRKGGAVATQVPAGGLS